MSPLKAAAKAQGVTPWHHGSDATRLPRSGATIRHSLLGDAAAGADSFMRMSGSAVIEWFLVIRGAQTQSPSEAARGRRRARRMH